MKLHDGELVQWDDGTQWHRGRVVRNDDAEPIRDSDANRWLVRHSYTAELEMVLWETLEPQSEGHPE